MFDPNDQVAVPVCRVSPGDQAITISASVDDILATNGHIRTVRADRAASNVAATDYSYAGTTHHNVLATESAALSAEVAQVVYARLRITPRNTTTPIIVADSVESGE